ncbi:MAG TPA: hypothetical protein ENJ18_09435 [Nannocystis exedens]|nr:hypothetical protein [Nannocystis exedens]
MSRPPPSARGVAVRVLRQVQQRRGFSNRILAEQLSESGLDRRDRGLVTTLVYGVLRHRARLDALIDSVARRPAGIKGRAREILRVAVLELRELDHPAHAAISEAVRGIAMFDRRGALVAVAQAILSRISVEGETLDLSLGSGKPLDVLARRWSVPRWLAGRWIKRLGPERAELRARAMAEPPSLDLRIDCGQMSAEQVAEILRTEVGASVSTVVGQGQALRVRGGGALSEHRLFRAGVFSIQALGSQQPALLLKACAGERILDACAGMGTKTLQLAEMMGRRGTIVAADRSILRLDEQVGLATRGGLCREELDLRIVSGDLRDELEGVDDGPLFDGVLLDAPCTGLGNLGRHPELRFVREFADLAACVQLQRQLLEACWRRVRSGGRLVYAVCSLEPEEGEVLVASVAAEHGLRVALERTWTPEEEGCDGFYVARIEA